jgi:hypothetical protein
MQNALPAHLAIKQGFLGYSFGATEPAVTPLVAKASYQWLQHYESSLGRKIHPLKQIWVVAEPTRANHFTGPRSLRGAALSEARALWIRTLPAFTGPAFLAG